MTFRAGLIASLLVCTAAPAAAEIYRNVDADGNVTYSDEPSSGSEAIDVQPVTTITLPKLEDVTTQSAAPERAEPASESYSNLEIIAPGNNEAFHSGSGDVAFRVTSSPALRQGHKYEISLDGQPVGQSTSGDILVRNIDRGTHQATVNIIDSNGMPVQSGGSVSFTIHRPSSLH
ncbi:DUF4124 domain-containing protein [Marinobacter zhejiangensis]|uniref:DUF4124 domain-containing protein n=1 Tax=Marinobacter zhejiangensis TaxID=488535 RepID=A0A1I4SDJ3_9GAMM|nr:DUF4124 domain-containing protein [Marinobacter zhejiangensis]SFM62568.1 protein of unknown function [Marinobacter zhejiangensis]